MNSDIFKPHCAQHRTMLKFQASRIKRLLFGFLLSSQMTCLLWGLKPLFDDDQRAFPFLMWMPVKPDHSPQYELGYIFQFVSVSTSAFIYFGVDSVVLSMVIFGCAELDIIKNKIMSIQSVDHKIKKEEKREKMVENYQKLVESVKHHQAIETFIQLVENTYHTYLFFQLCGSVGVICMSGLRILVVPPRSMQFLSIFLYVVVISSQIFVCCWCGHELTARSESLNAALYQCNWFEQDVKFKKALLFVMMRTSLPLVLRAGHYVQLSRQTFVTILRTSYSYFAVLYQTYKE